jgi:hypothetical protein
MSIITALALIVIALLTVLALAACASFPSRLSPELDPPEGDWIGRASLPRGDTAKPVAAPHTGARANPQRLKMHSWI